MKADCEVLIIGSGAAGLITAIELAQKGIKVIVVTKDAITESSSSYAQGGVAVPLALGDSIEQHICDTLRVGQSECNEAAVRFYISSIEKYVRVLHKWGIPFNGLQKDGIDERELGNEAAHSQRRILKIGSDIAGRVLMKHLWEIACRNPNLSISQGTNLVNLIKDRSKKCAGGVFQDINNSLFPIIANCTVLATGGASSLYAKSTTPFVITGDGIACAYRIGANVKDLDYIQFHPTALDHPTSFLLSETLRGEGAILLNNLNERFMERYAPLEKELAPRAVVSKAVWQEIKKTGKVFIDVRQLGKEYLLNKFQGIYNHCLELGFNLADQLVPVTPAAHYTIGGITVDLESKTSIPGLWAVGEVANTGLHGADRLASNSLLECIVSAFSAAESISNSEALKTEPNLSELSKKIVAFQGNLSIVEFKS
ncbi:MAG: FAD-dependent oxidoreductase, partial [Candidatus Caenarcaniphilales bacterium]|nr:FAD-dependent oxidoreductase [Candidatus Caenarcaniphilales bacterium]